MDEAESFTCCPGVLAHVPAADVSLEGCRSGGLDLTGGKLLLGTLTVRRLLRKPVLADDEASRHLDSAIGRGVLGNAADGHRPAWYGRNRNYTVSPEVLNQCLRQAKIRHVLTRRRGLEPFPL